MSHHRLVLSIFWLTTTLVAGLTTADDREASTVPTEAGLETATFSMFCYWTGEATLGQVDGVVASRIGHWSGNEIVQVDYDPSRTDLGEMAAALAAKKSIDFVVADDKASRKAAKAATDGREVRTLAGTPHFIEPKHSLRTRFPQLAALELTEAQAIALNSWSYFGGPMPDVLTEEQKAQLGQ